MANGGELPSAEESRATAVASFAGIIGRLPPNSPFRIPLEIERNEYVRAIEQEEGFTRDKAPPRRFT